jgi:hypothetical protein
MSVRHPRKKKQETLHALFKRNLLQNCGMVHNGSTERTENICSTKTKCLKKEILHAPKSCVTTLATLSTKSILFTLNLANCFFSSAEGMVEGDQERATLHRPHVVYPRALWKWAWKKMDEALGSQGSHRHLAHARSSQRLAHWHLSHRETT